MWGRGEGGPTLRLKHSRTEKSSASRWNPPRGRLGGTGRRSRLGSKDDGAPFHRSAPLGSQIREAFSAYMLLLPKLLGEAESPSGFGCLSENEIGVGKVRGAAELQLSEPPFGPLTPRFGASGLRSFGAPGLEAWPSPPPTPARGPGGRRPRPRGGRPRARGRTAATQWRPRLAQRASAASSPPRAGGAGRFQNRPARWGEGSGGEEKGGRRAPRAAAGTSHPSQQIHSVVPVTPRDERSLTWASQPPPARPRLHHTHPWTPFSLLPSRSLNVRLPLAFPLGAALRRRETRNLGRYHRARPRG